MFLLPDFLSSGFRVLIFDLWCLICGLCFLMYCSCCLVPAFLMYDRCVVRWDLWLLISGCSLMILDLCGLVCGVCFLIDAFWFLRYGLRPLAYARYVWLSGFWLLRHGFWFLLSAAWFMMSDFGVLLSDAWFPIYEFCFQISDMCFWVVISDCCVMFMMYASSFLIYVLCLLRFAFWFLINWLPDCLLACLPAGLPAFMQACLHYWLTALAQFGFRWCQLLLLISSSVSFALSLSLSLLL